MCPQQTALNCITTLVADLGKDRKQAVTHGEGPLCVVREGGSQAAGVRRLRRGREGPSLCVEAVMVDQRPQEERRSGKDRRSGVDRRKATGGGRRTPGQSDRRSSLERRMHDRRRTSDAPAPEPPTHDVGSAT